jgi:effector-binding domain-containing protein
VSSRTRLQALPRGSVAGVRHEVMRVTQPARRTAVVAATTTWKAFPTLWAVLLPEVHGRLGDRAGLNVMLYLDDVPNVEVGVLAEAAFTPGGRITASSLPAGDVAMTIHRGPYEELGAAHRAVVEWCAARELARTGVRWEIYGHHADDPAQRVTEVHHLLAPSPSAPR